MRERRKQLKSQARVNYAATGYGENVTLATQGSRALQLISLHNVLHAYLDSSTNTLFKSIIITLACVYAPIWGNAVHNYNTVFQ